MDGVIVDTATMNRFRILLLSNVRPSRAWKLAVRLKQEIPAAEICGMVQRSMRTLPRVQQRIAAGNLRERASASLWSRLGYCCAAGLQKLMHAGLWVVHGCPVIPNQSETFTVEKLRKRCDAAGFPFATLESPTVPDFIRRRQADLTIVIGDFSDLPESVLNAANSVLRAGQSDSGSDKEATDVTIEHLARVRTPPVVIASVKLPRQQYETPLEIVLKSDLIADDLLLQAAAHLKNADAGQTACAAGAWAQKMFAPYVRQFDGATAPTPEPAPPQRYRSLVKLCLHTLVLCSILLLRNWYRRWRRQYPVVIVAHHLVTDRPHRMALTTRQFWKQVRFLQRHYRIVSLSHAAELLRSGSVTAPTLVLTFDDGYLDNFVSLRAIAGETDVPVAHFVATEPISRHREFEHDLAHDSRGAFPLMWEQIRYWSRRGAEFGSHTRTHFNCGSNDEARLGEEILGSKADLQAELGKSVNFFAFPFGKRENVSARALELAEFGYEGVLSSLGGENFAGHNQQHLLRKSSYSDPWELELELQSVFELVSTIKRFFGGPRTKQAGLPRALLAGGALQQADSMPMVDQALAPLSTAKE